MTKQTEQDRWYNIGFRDGFANRQASDVPLLNPARNAYLAGWKAGLRKAGQ
jgi:hypothetical protein